MEDVMPNWCDCDLEVEGPEEDRAWFKEFARSGKDLLSADRFIPYPGKFFCPDKAAKRWDEKVKAIPDEEERRGFISHHPRPKDGFNSGGYEWCVEHWGTKWGICDAEIVEDNEYDLIYKFQCAWSPPNPVIVEMSKQFPGLTFTLRYFEGGAGYNGILRCSEGKCVQDETAQYFGNRGG